MKKNNSEENGNGNGKYGGEGDSVENEGMTEEQVEILRTQIAVYSALSHQLLLFHHSLTALHHLPGAGLGNLYCDPLVTAVGHKITGRQRWTPTPVQLQILERIFDQGTATPSKQKIKEITAHLSQHGQISDSNVYNWFQNRRARSKRKQLNNTESDAESPKHPDNFQSHHNSVPTPDNLDFQSQEISSNMQLINVHSGNMAPVFATDDSSKASQSLSQLAFGESILQNPRMDHLIGKMEVPGTYNAHQTTEDYSMTG